MERKKKNVRSDDQITADIGERMRWDMRMSIADIEFHVARGVVTLRGAVDSTFRKDAVLRSVLSTQGVSGLRDGIDVVDGYSRSDIEIENIIKNQLKPIVFSSGEWIDVSVKDGVVKLDGKVRWPWHKAIAAQIGWSLSGVRDCVNLIGVGGPGEAQTTSLSVGAEVNELSL